MPSRWLLAQSAGFPALPALILFAAAGRVNLPLYWAYIAVLEALSIGGLLLIGEDLARERMRPGGQPPPWSLRFALFFCLAHWLIAGLDRGRYQWSDRMPLAVRLVAFVVFVLGFALTLWAMHVNPFFSSAVRIQRERGQHVIAAGPYRRVRHPGYAGAIPAITASGLVLCSWLATALGAMGALWLLWRTAVEDRMLSRELLSYQDYTRQVRWRLVPGVW
jgi:protein-S-isoprenylcysteine O-methyltransferase Ste14